MKATLTLLVLAILATACDTNTCNAPDDVVAQHAAVSRELCETLAARDAEFNSLEPQGHGHFAALTRRADSLRTVQARLASQICEPVPTGCQ